MAGNGCSFHSKKYDMYSTATPEHDEQTCAECQRGAEEDQEHGVNE
jgi:hypothetical protein